MLLNIIFCQAIEMASNKSDERLESFEKKYQHISFPVVLLVKHSRNSEK